MAVKTWKKTQRERRRRRKCGAWKKTRAAREAERLREKAKRGEYREKTKDFKKRPRESIQDWFWNPFRKMFGLPVFEPEDRLDELDEKRHEEEQDG